MDESPALDLWDVMIKVFTFIEEYRITNPRDSRKLLAKSQIQTQTKEKRDVDQLSLVDYVTTHAKSSQGESQLCTFEDIVAVITMIIKGRSPTMRHVSRTHRVALDWLFDRINLDPKIQIKYVDTKNLIADMVTKGSFTRDEWDHLLRLLKIMNLSMFSCSHSSLSLSNSKQSAMSKRAQESTSKEGSALAKPMNLVSRNLLSAEKDPPQDSGNSNSPGLQEMDQSCVSSSGKKPTRNINQNPTTYSQERQQDDTQSSSNLPVPGNWGGEKNLRAQPAPRNWSEVKTSKSESQSWSSATCGSLVVGASGKSSKSLRKSRISQKKKHQ